MLNESQCLQVEKALTNDIEPRKLAAYLCLHMGLTVAEVTALKLSDINLSNSTLSIHNTLTRITSPVAHKYEIIDVECNRTLHIPPHVVKLINENINLYPDPDCFLINGDQTTPSAHLLQNLLLSINNKYNITKSLTAMKLRTAFIRRCLENDIDICTTASYVGVKHIGEIYKKFNDYIIPKPDKINALEKYGNNFTIPSQPYSVISKRMSLLILGAGSQGSVVKEIADNLGIFKNIAYLDDNTNNHLAIDICDNYEKYINLFPIAIPSFGNCDIRAKWLERLEKAGFVIPTLIHPMATVSPSAIIDEGTVIEMKATIGTNARIKRGCIISSGAVVDLNAVINDNTHIDSYARIKKDTVLPPFSFVSSGEVVG